MDQKVLRSYTRALRHPVIVGHVAGWRLPWALSASQLAAVAVAAGVLLAARPVWAHLGSVGNLVFFGGVVVGVGWMVRAWRVEGRSPFRAGVGFVSVWVSVGSRRGVRNGRPVPRCLPFRSSTVGVPVGEFSSESE